MNDMIEEFISQYWPLLCLILSGIVEVSKIKINPWTALFTFIGDRINGRLIEKVDNLDKEVKDLRNVCDERDATLMRTHILHFNDEILHQKEHTKEHFDQILEDIDAYNTYCDNHENYKNNKAVFAIENIKRTYAKCMERDKFL